MFHKNLQYYRLKKAMSQKELASIVNVSPMAISNYEKGLRKPNMDVLKQLAKALNVRVSDFLAIRNENLVFSHGEFRKNTKLLGEKQQFVRESVEEYFNRFFTVVELLGGEILPEPPQCHVLPVSGDSESDAQSLRQHLNLSLDGPINDLIGILENKGILFYICDLNNDQFSGMNGFVNNRPYIVLNGNMTSERNRSTVAHELAHLMFVWPNDIAKRNAENAATAISGAFLFPKDDAIRELGLRRTSITKDMLLIAKEYGISMFLLVKRAYLSGIISQSIEKQFYIQASRMGWRKGEPSRIGKEEPILFKQLVYRAVNENEISIQRGAELLKVPYEEIVKHCFFNGD